MTEEAAAGLSDETGARPPGPRDPRVDGLSPSLVFEPEDEAACARALRLCHEEGLAVLPIGGGTRLALGNAPSRLDAYLVLDQMKGVEDHIPGDLTVAVKAGTSLAALQGELARAEQFLPLDAPSPERATIGGILSCAEPGLRRRPGARPRDVLLGFEAVLADGTRVKSGGRVVKNVAGFEVSKLLVGSFGTLAVITRAFLRLRAIPEHVATLWCPMRDAEDADDAWRDLRDLPLPPEAAAFLNSRAALSMGLENEHGLLLRFEGLVEETRGAVFDVQGVCRSELLGDPPWDAVRDFPLRDVPLMLRGQVAPARTFHLADGWREGGAVVALPDAGVVYSANEAEDALPDRQERAAAQGAAVVLERAPEAVKRDVDVFGELPSGFELMKRIKQKLDPKGILSPGRFVGRL